LIFDNTIELKGKEVDPYGSRSNQIKPH